MISSGCGNAEPFALQVIDNSMEPEFPKNCVIIIEPTQRCDSGAFIFAEYHEDRWFRRYVEHEGRKFLVALNEIYPNIEMQDDFSVLGLVVQRNVKRKIKHYPMGQPAVTREELGQQVN